MTIKAPFPYFGGKSAVAGEVWRRFGDVKNYVEPFFGSGAVLLGRPHWRPDGPRLVETVNDADGLLANFWRAMTADPESVAHHADWPVNEADLHARHLWLVGQRDALTERLMGDPEWFDAKAAGWWVWSMGANAIPRGLFTERASIVAAGNRSAGVIAGFEQGWARPLLRRLSRRLRHVRVRCGDWSRCVQSRSMMGHSDRAPFGVFLDPPYAGTDAQYATDGEPERDAWAWACANGDNPDFRICVAGYDDGREVPEGWVTVAWEAGGGYGNKADGEGRANAKRERLWFSPHCLRPDEGQMTLFGGGL